MSIPTVNVLVTAHEQDGSPAVGAQVIAKLMTTERYNGFVVPDEYSGVTNDDGNCTISLFPNELGTEGSEYKFKIIHRNGKTVNVFASIPNYDCSLHQISELDRYELRGAGQILTLEVAGYANEAIVARDNARAAELSAVNYALIAQGHKSDAEAAAATATTKASEASASATSIVASAASATTSAANAANSATAANIAKVAAESARDTVGTYRNEAVSARDKAELWAEQASDVAVETGKYSAKHHAAKAAASATAASISKDTATTKANEATASATAAANSATSASTSATTATTQAGNAQTSVNAAAAAAGNASASASTANTKAAEAVTSATNAANSASAAATSKSGAEAAMASTVTYRDEAQAATLKAKAWADNNENVYVEGSSYSAKHHAIKAAASASLASTHKDAAASSATSASNSATNAANSATTATTKANQAAVSATAAANSATDAELAAASIGVMSESGTLNVGEDTITLTLAYDTALGNVAVYLSGVKQEKSSLTFVDQYNIKVAEPVSELTTWEVTSVTMAGESVLTALRDEADAVRDEVVAIRQVMPGKNKIINGNFDIWQRGDSQTTSGFGSADRWICGNVGSTKVVSKQSFAPGQTEVPGNPMYFMRTVISSVVGAANFTNLAQPIENVRTLAGKRATISFYAKADAPKNLVVALNQSFGTGGTPSDMVLGIYPTLVGLTTSWTKYVITVDIPSIAGKTIGTHANSYLQLVFWFDAGSSFASRTANIGHQSGTFDIAQVQLEEGSVATPFEERHIGEELALCQRYYQKYIDPPLRGVVSYAGIANRVGMILPVQLRSIPTAVITASFYDGGAVSNQTSVVTSWCYTDSVEFDINVSPALSPGRAVGCFKGSGSFIVLDAEL